MEKQEKQDLPAGRHPSWLRVRAPFGEKVHELKKLMAGLNLNTVCQEARCPNMGECWAHGVATFMILGDVCTRGCRYCAVSKGTPSQVDWVEPERVGEAVRAMDLSHVVITSVDRDDLDDGGADLFARTILAVRRRSPKCVVEVLIPDFKGDEDALETVGSGAAEGFGIWTGDCQSQDRYCAPIVPASPGRWRIHDFIGGSATDQTKGPPDCK